MQLISSFLQLLPLLFIVFAAWFSLRGSQPTFSLNRTTVYTQEMQTLVGEQKYYVESEQAVKDAATRAAVEREVLSARLRMLQQDCNVQRYNLNWYTLQQRQQQELTPACTQFAELKQKLNVAGA